MTKEKNKKFKTVERVVGKKKINLSVGDIVSVKKNKDRTWTIVQEQVVADEFILIEAESLDLDDEFMKYDTKSNWEAIVKEGIIEAIEAGVKNFFRPKYADPFLLDGGKEVIKDRSYQYWLKAAKKYAPEHGSRLGTRLEYYAFVGVLIKTLVKSGKTVEWAWNAVCREPRTLSCYLGSKEAENTELRALCGLFNIHDACATRLLFEKYYANILADDSNKEVYWMAGGTYDEDSLDYYPIGKVSKHHDFDPTIGEKGWLVLTK